MKTDVIRPGMRLLAACLLSLITLLSTTAMAQPSASDKAAAEALFQQAKKLFDSGDNAQACAKFDASQRLDPAVGTLLYLGDCYEKLGKSASAWASFKEASSLAERTGDKRKETADIRISALQPRVSYLKVNVAGGTEGIVVRQNGVDVAAASWGAALPVDAGSYNIEASAPGKQAWSKSVDIADGGSTVSVDVPLLADPSAAPPPPQPGAPRQPQPAEEQGRAGGSSLVVAGAVIAGVGVIGLVVGGVMGGMAISSNDDSLAECRPEDETVCSQAGFDLREDAKTQALVSTIGFIGGGVLLAAGVVMIIVAPSGDADTTGLTVEVGPTVGSEHAGLTLRGSW
jgi:hypothetical protein